MIVVADACVLVADLVRERGWEFGGDARIHLVMAEEQWSETRHEIARRLPLRIKRGQLTAGQASRIQQEIQALVQEGTIEVVPADA